MKRIEIDEQIFETLKDYCDRQNLRLKDFIEDALENAIWREEAYKAAEEAKSLMKTIEKECDKAYWRGFVKGFYAAFCTCQGKLGVYAEADKKKKMAANFKWVTGPQLTLFQ